MLLEHGSSTQIQNYHGYNVKHWALFNGFDRIEELIPTIVQYMLPIELSDYMQPVDFAPTALGSDKYLCLQCRCKKKNTFE